jgi:hypothetical protein
MVRTVLSPAYAVPLDLEPVPESARRTLFEAGSTQLRHRSARRRHEPSGSPASSASTIASCWHDRALPASLVQLDVAADATTAAMRPFRRRPAPRASGSAAAAPSDRPPATHQSTRASRSQDARGWAAAIRAAGPDLPLGSSPTPGRPRPSGSARRSASPTTGPRAPPDQYGVPAHRRYVPARMCGVPALAYCRHSSHDRSPTAGEGSGMSRFLDIGARMAVDSELPRTPRTRTRLPREPGLRRTRPPSCAAWPMFAAEPAYSAPRAMSRSFVDDALPTWR